MRTRLVASAHRSDVNNSSSYCGYRVEFVYGKTTREQKQRIVDFWQRNGVIKDPSELVRRVSEVVLIAIDQTNAIVGVNTVYADHYPPDGQRYFFYRMFIQPGNRETRLAEFMTRQAYNLLREHELPDKPRGIMFVTENNKLMRPGMRGVLQRLGFRQIDENELDQGVWIQKW